MPKQKTCKSASKRFKKTGTGKIVHYRAGFRHILTKKTSKRKRRLGQSTLLKSSEMRRIKDALPYGLN